MSDDKQQAVLDAAQAQFLRYGFRRVTMGDIAAAVAMSRPALYLLFPNKEAIFKGVYSRFVCNSLAEIEAGIGEIHDVAEKLAFAVEIWTVRPYELLHHTPEGRELTDCSYGFAEELVQNSYQRFNAIIETILKLRTTTLKTQGLTPATAAEIFSMTLRGIKAGARDADHLRTLITNLIGMTAATFGNTDTRAAAKLA